MATRLALVDAPARSASLSAAPLLLLALDHRAWRSACSDAVQGARGLKGPIVIERAGDPYAGMYDEERVLFLSDEWRDPSVCLKVEGAMPGNDVCADIRHASFNGIFGNGSDAFPFPLVPVEAGKCYRLRMIMAGSNTENFIVSFAGHNMTLISLDGAYDIEPLAVSAVNLHLGERADVVLCADQKPGNYLINATYDYACSLTPGNFIPPGEWGAVKPLPPLLIRNFGRTEAFC